MTNPLLDLARSFNEQMAEGCLQVGRLYRHPEDGRLVRIKSGAYLHGGRISNFWYWNDVNPDGSLGQEGHGYGWHAAPIDESEA